MNIWRVPYKDVPFRMKRFQFYGHAFRLCSFYVVFRGIK